MGQQKRPLGAKVAKREHGEGRNVSGGRGGGTAAEPCLLVLLQEREESAVCSG